MADVVRRIQKLLQLSRHNGSEQEAANAAAIASELMFKYQVGEADLDVESPERPVEEVVDQAVRVDPASRREVWKGALGSVLAKSFGCTMYTWREAGECRYMVVGLKSAVESVQYLFSMLVLELGKMARDKYRECGSQGNPRTWQNSFRLGAVNVIGQRLREQAAAQEAEVKQRERAAPGSTALALYRTDQDRVAQEYRRVERAKNLVSIRNKYRRHVPTAYEQGRQAGHAVRLDARERPGIPAAKPRVEG